MSGVATAIAGAAVVGAIASDQASQRAASAQKDAAKKSNSEAARQYDLTRKDNEAWRQAGGVALGELAGNKFMDNWQQDPGYQFRMSEGQKALQASSAARGLSNSGRALKELTRYGQDYASNEYGNAYNRQYGRLSALAGIGQQANAQNASSGANFANMYGQNTMGAANAQAAAGIAQANALGNAANSGANAFMISQMMKK